MALDPTLKDLAGADNFAAFTTLMADGQPQTQVMWVGADDDHVLINTEPQRQKFLNVERDPRVTVTVWNKANPYQYVEVRGRVVETVGGEEALAHIDELSQKYTQGPYSNPIGPNGRVILKIAAEKLHRNGV